MTTISPFISRFVAARTSRFLWLLFIVFSFTYSSGQRGALDLSFDPGTGADSTVFTTAVQADGKILIGGAFSTYNGQPRPFIARLNPDGSLDNTFNLVNGPNEKVHRIVVQPDGKILVGGDKFNGIPSKKIIRLLPDGTQDSTFEARVLAGGIKEVVLQPDGKILVGGNFLSVDSLPYAHLARLHSNGQLDTTFNTKNALSGTVVTIVVQPDGKAVIGGSFTSYFGVNGYRVARVNTNGSVDSTFNPGIGGAGSNVEALGLLQDGRMMIGGQFTFYNGSTLGYVTRTSTDGTIDFSFLQNPGANLPIYAIKMDNDSSFWIGGNFTTYQGLPAARIAKITADGYLDTLFSSGAGPSDDVRSISSQQNGKLIIGGNFETYDGIPRCRIARLYNCQTPPSDSIFGNAYALCSGVAQTYTATPVAGATSYVWTLPNGWIGSSNSNSITISSNGQGGLLSVSAFTDSCGLSVATTRSIATLQPPSTPICLVTVDTASTHNIIIWEKPQTDLIDSFIIYRETASNIYSRIAAVPYDLLSEYRDTSANPNVTSYRYKLSVLDTCGAESDLSDFHRTIHLQNFGMGNFQWTFYQIQNQLNPVLSFNVYRDNLGNGNFLPIGNIPGTNSTFTDITYASYPNSEYVIDANWSISCEPTRAVNTTRSNIKRIKEIDFPIETSLLENTLAQLQIFPNPAQAFIQISMPENIMVQQIQLMNPLGQIIARYPASTTIATDHLPTGVYYLHFDTNVGTAVRKILIAQ